MTDYATSNNEVIVHSSRTGHGPYRVSLGSTGHPKSCPCIGFTRWGHCWHVERAELEQPFQAAKRYLEQTAPAGFDFAAKFQATLEALEIAGAKHPELEAVKRVIQVAYEHRMAAQQAAKAVVKKARKNAGEGRTCPRCGGEGWIQHFLHVEDGICFRCRGTGVDPH